MLKIPVDSVQTAVDNILTSYRRMYMHYKPNLLLRFLSTEAKEPPSMSVSMLDVSSASFAFFLASFTSSGTQSIYISN